MLTLKYTLKHITLIEKISLTFNDFLEIASVVLALEY